MYLWPIHGDWTTQESLSLCPEERRFGVFSVVFSSDGREILSGANDGYFYIYDRECNQRAFRVRRKNLLSLVQSFPRYWLFSDSLIYQSFRSKLTTTTLIRLCLRTIPHRSYTALVMMAFVRYIVKSQQEYTSPRSIVHAYTPSFHL